MLVRKDILASVEFSLFTVSTASFKIVFLVDFLKIKVTTYQHLACVDIAHFQGGLPRFFIIFLRGVRGAVDACQEDSGATNSHLVGDGFSILLGIV